MKIPSILRNRFLFGMLGVALLAVTTASSVHTADPDPKAITLKPIAFDGLSKAIAAHKGKVVVLDIWGDFCIPCKKKFPHFVQMHKDLAKDGLVCMSLSLDEPKSKDAEAALKFLQQVGATFENYLLDDTDDNKKAWETKLQHDGPPIVHIFDRSGKKVKTLDAEIKPEEIEKFVKELLKQK